MGTVLHCVDAQNAIKCLEMCSGLNAAILMKRGNSLSRVKPSWVCAMVALAKLSYHIMVHGSFFFFFPKFTII